MSHCSFGGMPPAQVSQRKFISHHEKHSAQKNVINPDRLTTLRMPITPTIRILWTNVPLLLSLRYRRVVYQQSSPSSSTSDLLVSGLRHNEPASQAQNTVQPMRLHLQMAPLQADLSHPHRTISRISSGASFVPDATVRGFRSGPSRSNPWSIALSGGDLRLTSLSASSPLDNVLS